jgi:hypothetical protein
VSIAFVHNGFAQHLNCVRDYTEDDAVAKRLCAQDDRQEQSLEMPFGHVPSPSRAL